MKHQIDEALLTAYALGEVSPEEAARVEKFLQASPESRHEVEDIRRTAALLYGEFAGEASPALTLEQRERIQHSGGKRVGRRAWFTTGLPLAASVLLVALLAYPREEPSLGQRDEFTRSPRVENTGRAEQSGSTETEMAFQRRERTPPQSEAPNALRSDPAEVDTGLPETVGKSALAGVITDPSGAAIPGAEVKLLSEAGRTAGQTVTNDSGRFALSDVPAGSYRLRAHLPGFKTREELVRLTEGKRKDVRAQLEVAEVSETVTVTGDEAGNVHGLQMQRARVASMESALRSPRVASSLRHGMSFAALPAEPDMVPDIPAPPGDFNTEAYDRIQDNPFILVGQDPLSTFSIDVDTASYSNVRRFLEQRQLPPKDAVRIEELINYFPYAYEPPSDGRPFVVHLETAAAPWKSSHSLVRIGLKGREIDMANRPAGNFVFLIDVSGSMEPANKLPLLKKAFRLLIENLSADDRVAMVVYAGATGLVLPSTSCERKEEILDAVERLQAGGSTNGGAGIQLAYKIASENLIPGGINRVILATDGDFNVGVTNQGDLTRLIEDQAKSRVFLSVLGFGMGNYKDSTLEKLADQGNGNYAYIDTLHEARKVLVEEVGGTLVTIAKDVKIQVEFNPATVQAYRLIGYENRLLRHQDFNDDSKDAGDIGAGHTITALYEVVPPGVEINVPSVDPLKYQSSRPAGATAENEELLTVKLRYKEPQGSQSRLLEYPLAGSDRGFEQASADFRFAAAVASFGMILRDSPHKGNSSFDAVIALAEKSRGADPHGYRADFVRLARLARALWQVEDLR